MFILTIRSGDFWRTCCLLLAPRTTMHHATSMHHARHVHAVAHRSVELLTAGSPEEAEEASLLAAAAPAPGSGALGGRGARPGGAERPYFWAAGIRFSLKYLFSRSVFRPFSAKNSGFPIRFCLSAQLIRNEGYGILR